MAVTLPVMQQLFRVRRPARRSVGLRVKLRWQRLFVAAASIVYVLALLVCLYLVVHPIWGYTGFGWTPPANPLFAILAVSLSVTPSLYLPLTFRRPSGFVLWMMYLMVFAPAQVIPVFAANQTTEYLHFQIALAACFLVLCIVAELPAVSLRRLTVSPDIFWLGLAAFSLATYVLVVRTYGLPTTVPAIGDVYSLRSEFREESAGVPVFLAYAIGWQSKVINPLLIANGIARKSLISLVAGGIGQVFLYATAGHKSVLFSGLLVIAVLAGQLWGGKYLGVLATAGAASLVILSSLVALVMNSTMLVTLFVRRLLMIPGLLTGYYQDFFSSNPKTMDLDPLTRRLFDSSYDERAPFVIGRVYFDRPEMSANAHLWADGYAAFGVTGMVVVTLLLGTILWTFNSMSVGRNPALASMLVAVPAFNLTNSALFPSIGSHGIAFALVLLFFIPEASRSIAERKKHLKRHSGRKDGDLYWSRSST